MVYIALKTIYKIDLCGLEKKCNFYNKKTILIKNVNFKENWVKWLAQKKLRDMREKER